MTLLHISPTLGYRRSMAPDGYLRRSPPTKPFLLRGDRSRCVTIGAPLLNKPSPNESRNEPLSLYDMRKMGMQHAARRRIVSMAENLSPRSTLLSFEGDYNPAHVRRASQLALNSLYDSSPESSPPATPDERPMDRHSGWQFPLPPISISKSKQAPSLDLCQDVLPGLGLEGLGMFTFAEAPLANTEMTTSVDKSPTASSASHYDSDNAPSSHWSPSTCAPSLCEEERDECEISFTGPLTIRKSGSRQTAVTSAEDGVEEQTGREDEDEDDYLRPFQLTTDGDDAKLERLQSSYSLLGVTSCTQGEAPSSPQGEEDDGEVASPSQEAVNLRLLLSPEHAAPSLAEQLAFACGNGYQYQLPHDRTHRDSAGEYLLPQALSPLVMTPAQLSSLDPFLGLMGECGDSWSETHSAANSPEPHTGYQLTEGVHRSGSTHVTHRRMSIISTTSPILKGDLAALHFMPRSKSHVGHFKEEKDHHSCVSESTVTQDNISLPTDTGVLLSSCSPAPPTLEEFSYLTLLDREDEHLTVSSSKESGSSLPDERSQIAKLPMEVQSPTSPAQSTEQSAPLCNSTTRDSVSGRDGLSPSLSDLNDDYSANVTFSQMKRSSTATSILDRGRPVRPSSGGSFLGQREDKIHVIKLKTGLSGIECGKIATSKSPSPESITSAHSAAVSAQVKSTRPAESVKKEYIARNTSPDPPRLPAAPAMLVKAENRGSPSVQFRTELPTVQVATRVRVMSSSTSRGVPMGMVRSTSRPGDSAGIEAPVKISNTAPVKMLSVQAAAALREAKLEMERKTGKSISANARPTMLPGVRSAGEVPQSSHQKGSESASVPTQGSLVPPRAPERSRSAPAPAPAPAPPAQPMDSPITVPRPARPLKAAARPCHPRDRGLGGVPSSFSLPTLFTARTASQRLRGETGLAETQATLAAAAAAARANRKSSSPLSRLMTSSESGVKVEKICRPKRWGMVKALTPEERSTVRLDTPSGCVLILQEQMVVKETIASA